ncbi:MAG: hypothetical protein ACOYMA_22735 [Bacteroidia bacterium]
MTIKNYSKNFIICALVITIASCSKYERTNPNDLLGSDGTPVLAIDGYEVIIDNNGDTKLQKGETATLKVLVKNTGNKVTQINTAIFTSNSTKIVIENFSPVNNLTSYAGKTNSIGNLRIKIASNATVGETLTCNAKLTDKDGRVFNSTLTFIVSEPKPSVLSIISADIKGLNDENLSFINYSKGLSPIFQMAVQNNSNNYYNDDLTINITSLNSTYPYQFTIKEFANISSKGLANVEIWLDCLPTNIPNNTILPINVAVTDKFGETVEKQINVTMRPNISKLDFISFEIWSGSETRGSYVALNSIVKNSGGKTLNFHQSGAKISTTSPYLDILSIQIINETINQNETSNNLFSFGARISSNCPVNTKMPITIELSTNEKCPTKFTSVVELEIK